MMGAVIHILHLEDDPLDAELVQARLTEYDLDYRMARVQTRDEFENALREGGVDLILADYRLPGYDGMSALRRTLAWCPDVPFIFVSGTMGEEAAIDALTRGATDYVLKQNLSRLEPAIKRALIEARNRRERQRQSMINAARLRLMQFAATHSLDELLEESINAAEKETDSQIGFYAIVDDDQQSVALQNWSTRTKTQFCKARGKGLHYPITDAGVWVDCFHRRRPVIHNDYLSLAHRKGLPEEHAELIRELVVPVIRGDNVKAILGVGNKPTDYTETDVEAMSLLADLVWEIAERKQVQQRVAMLSFALNGIHEAAFMIDEKACFQYVNDEACRLLGYTRDDLLSMGPADVNPDISMEDWPGHWSDLKSGGTMTFEAQFKTRDGRPLAVEVNANYFEYERQSYDLSLVRDITERKKLEEQLRHIQKMEAIGQLAGGIAHDFNNILSAITGYTELSMSVLEAESQVVEYLSQVMDASKRAKELINQIMMFSRETEQELKPLRISLPVKEALKLIRASIPASIEIRSCIQSQASAVADPTQIHQIVMNLCTNAAHAMQEKGGLLELHLTDITIDHEGHRKNYPDAKPGDYIRLTVTDQGYGIDANYIHRIFDPFFTTKVMGEGTGMGLSVVHGIVKSYGGYIYVSSRLKEGSMFDILIPSHECAGPSEAILDVPIPKGSESILFVDDETVIVDVVKRTLETLGYQVVARTTATEALEVFKKNPDGFDLVITDMSMPRMSGLDLAEKIFQIKPGFPIVLCTGFNAEFSERNIAECGLRDIIYKPILRRDMATVVRNVLDQRGLMNGDTQPED